MTFKLISMKFWDFKLGVNVQFLKYAMVVQWQKNRQSNCQMFLYSLEPECFYSDLNDGVFNGSSSPKSLGTTTAMLPNTDGR